MSRAPYRVYCLRYYPNLVTGEFVNVGVALVSKETGWWDARVTSDLPDITCLYPTAQVRALESVLSRIARRLSERSPSNLVLDVTRGDPKEVFSSTVGPLNGSLRWSDPVLDGSASDLPRELDYWYRELLQATLSADAERAPATMAPEAKVAPLRGRMEQEFLRRGIRLELRPAIIRTYHEEAFEFTYRNGRLNVFEAVNLNTKQGRRIVRRGHEWRGRLDIIGEQERVAFFALIEMPSPKLASEAEAAIAMIRNARLEHVEALPEDEIERFGHMAADVVKGRT